MEKYHSYIPSGIEWIGDIPETWKVKRIGQLFLQRNETVSDTEYQPLSVSKNGIVPQMEGVAKTDNNDNRKLVKKGDFVINSRSDRKGSSGYSNLDGSVSVINIVLKPINIYPKYSHYLFRSYLFIEEFFRNGKGIVMDLWSTRYSEMKYMTIPYPPINEQHQIVEFLDSKTELIDKLISTKERKINLLKEQRISLINQVVTKGLNPNVKMKNSGVEWIGEIPGHWTKSKVKYVSSIFGRIGYRGYTVEDIVSEGEGVITISPSNIKNDIFTIEGENTFLSYEKYEESPEIQIFTNDIILVKTGSTIGKTSIIPSDVPKMTINPQLVVLKELKIDNKYFYYQTVCEYFKKSFLVEQTGSTTPTISQEKINGFPILIPSRQEQLQIVEHLDSKTKEIDDLVQLEQKKIDLLKEYRQSLISEVVTGKIKVTTDE